VSVLLDGEQREPNYLFEDVEGRCNEGLSGHGWVVRGQVRTGAVLEGTGGMLGEGGLHLGQDRQRCLASGAAEGIL
jgi:hypothetical protein